MGENENEALGEGRSIKGGQVALDESRVLFAERRATLQRGDEVVGKVNQHFGLSRESQRCALTIESQQELLAVGNNGATTHKGRAKTKEGSQI